MFAIFFFSKKIREICAEKGVKAGKWIVLLIVAWFGSEIAVFFIGFSLIGNDDSTLLVLVIPALIAAGFSAFLVLQKVKSIASNEDLELDEFATKRNEEDFKHFR